MEVISVTLRLLYTQYPQNRTMGGPTAGLDALDKKHISCVALCISTFQTEKKSDYKRVPRNSVPDVHLLYV
jgi:hypothetical protein